MSSNTEINAHLPDNTEDHTLYVSRDSIAMSTRTFAECSLDGSDAGSESDIEHLNNEHPLLSDLSGSNNASLTSVLSEDEIKKDISPVHANEFRSHVRSSKFSQVLENELRTSITRNISHNREDLKRSHLSIDEINRQINESTENPIRVVNRCRYIVTHRETFHTDEVMAATILSYIFSENGAVPEIVRTRNAVTIAEYRARDDAYIIDVGGEYDPSSHAYDHHQSTFNHRFLFSDGTPCEVTKLSSCGLIYMHLAETLWSKFAKREGLTIPDQAFADKLVDAFYRRFILPIDAIDNGVSEMRREYEKEARLYVNNVTLNGLVSALNTANVGDDAAQMVAFKNAMDVCLQFLLTFMRSSWHYHYNQRLNESRFLSIWNSPQRNVKDPLLVLPEKFDYAPLLQREDPTQKIKLIVLPRDTTPVTEGTYTGTWQIHTVNLPGQRFEHHVSILSEEAAKKLIGNDLVFVHSARFIGVCKTQEAAIKLARASIDAGERLVSSSTTTEPLSGYTQMGIYTGIAGFLAYLTWLNLCPTV